MIGKRMVQLEQEVIVVALPVRVQLFAGQPEIGFELVDMGKVRKDHRVVVGIFAAALAFIVAEIKGAVFRDGPAQGKAELVLPQLV